MDYKAIAEEVTKRAVEYFGDKLHCVLLYGSTIVPSHKPNDLDIIIVLKSRETATDVCFIQKQIELYNVEMDMQIINLQDIEPETFSHDSHGQFFIRFLQPAETLYGTNPFTNIHPTYTAQVTSVLQKAQYYYFRAKKIQAHETGNNIDPKFHRKKLLLMLSDFMLVYTGECMRIETNAQLSNVSQILLGHEVNAEDVKYLLEGDDTKQWKDIFKLYQNYFFSIADILTKKSELSISFVNSIYTELHDIRSDKIAVIASGMPTNYNENELIKFLHVRGYTVCTFHYTATGKSNGTVFRNPVEDISDVVNHYAARYEEVIVLGNSYGGYAALSLNTDSKTDVQMVIALSPVVSFQNVTHIETLPQHLEESDRYWYRFPKEQLLEFFQSAPLATLHTAAHYVIIHGVDDEQIDIKEIEVFCHENNMTCKNIEGKHFSFNRLTREKLSSLSVFL